MKNLQRISVALILATIILVLSVASTIHEAGGIGDISFGTAWLEGVAYDSGKGEIFVANQEGDTVSVISDSNNIVVATVNVGSSPHGEAYDSGRGEIFVTNSANDTISVISDSTNTVSETVNVGTYAFRVEVGIDPLGVTYDPGKGEIFVANYASNMISVNQILHFLPVPSVSASPATIEQGQSSTLNSTAMITDFSPYTYQWFERAPKGSYVAAGTNSPSFSFVTSKTSRIPAGSTRLTALGASCFR